MQTYTDADKKLNIAMLGHKRMPSREGGVEIVVEELSTRMAALGHKVTVYNRRGHHVGGSELDTTSVSEYKGVRVRSVLTIDKKGLAAITSALAASLRAAFGRYDVVHYHAEGPCIGCVLPRLTGKRVVATIHGLDHRRAKWGKLARTTIIMGEKCAVRYADEIIVLGDNLAEYFKQEYNRETVVIPNGVNRPDIHDADLIKSRWGLEADDYILYLGRIVPEKGLHYLIEAYKSLVAEARACGKDIDKKLVIAGGASDSSEYMEEVKQLASELGDRCIFTGFVQGSELEELYSNAYLYVLPSDLEGMPISLLEAMSYGNACLTSDIPECAGVIGEAGAVFRAGDADDLKDELKRLLEDSAQVKHYKEVAADYICSRYNWGDVTDKTLRLYRKHG